MLAGILLAPRSGREMRGGLADRAGEARQRGSETYFDARERLRERVSSGADTTTTPDLTPTRGPTRPAEPDFELSPEPSPEKLNAERPFLRDVSQAGPDEDPAKAAPESGRSDELRRKIRETRNRLNTRDNSEGGGGDAR